MTTFPRVMMPVLGMFLWICMLFGATAQAPATPAPEPAVAAPPPQELVIGTRQVPPFAFQNAKGEWDGLSIGLWREIAERLKLKYRFEDAGTVKELVSGVTDKRFDAGVAALTVTEERERLLDFSHSFFNTGLAIATTPSTRSPVLSALLSFFTWETLGIIAAVIGGIVLIGLILSIVERRAGNGDFDSASEGLWGSMTMFLTSQFTAPEPKSWVGRMLAVLWVIISIGAMTFLTGIVTSALTIQSLEGQVRGLADLPKLRVGAVKGSTGNQWLSDERIRATQFEAVPAGLAALIEGKLDAFVHDAPLLQYLARGEFEGRIVVLPDNFAPQDYAIAFPDGSALREPVNRELIAIKRSDAWKKRVFETLGER